VLNLLFIPRFGVVGAAGATVLTFGLYLFANVTLMYYEIQFDPLAILWPGIRVLAVTAGMGAVTVLVRPLITGIVTLLAAIAASVAVWLGLVITIGPVDVTEARSALGLTSSDTTGSSGE